MQTSEYFRIERTPDDDWFDAILDNDTKLFVDPFLIFKEDDPLWADSHDAIVAHFQRCFELIAEGRRNRRGPAYQKALRLLTFREPREMCLGYTALGTRGAGGGSGSAQQIAQAMEDAIDRGVRELHHFEELGILNEGIGPDRISDMTCTVLKPRFVEYTKQVADRHHIPVEEHSIFPTRLDEGRGSWERGAEFLPTNPANGQPLLLLPTRFLRDLPTLNPDDWWSSREASRLREDLNYDVMHEVRKKDIVELARRHPDVVRGWTLSKEDDAAQPYDLGRDPKGVYRWEPSSRAYVAQHPLTIQPPENQEQFVETIGVMVQQFRHFIEEDDGWKLLWDGGNEKNEEAAQVLFKGIVKHYCIANNIVVDREVLLGRGPVDFKFSNGYSRRLHLEVKKLDNGKFWNGLERQLPTYMRSDQCNYGWFLVLQQRLTRHFEDRLQKLPGRLRTLSEDRGIMLRSTVVDAMPKPSASTL